MTCFSKVARFTQKIVTSMADRNMAWCERNRKVADRIQRQRNLSLLKELRDKEKSPEEKAKYQNGMDRQQQEINTLTEEINSINAAYPDLPRD